MKNRFPNGVWPVMLTPFTQQKKIDYNALEKLVEWYINSGVDGLFAVCQSSEMFFLTQQEKIAVAKFVCKCVRGRVPVIASGHTADSIEEQAKDIEEMAKTGVDAVILLTNRLAQKEQSDDIWIENLNKLLLMIPDEIPLGFYECPYPYKRIMSEKVLKHCIENERFYFLKDTSCDIQNIETKLKIIKNSNIKLFNANTATLHDSLIAGAAGYSGVMANMVPTLYCDLCRHWNKKNMLELQDMLTIFALAELQFYPVNAKYFLQLEQLPLQTVCRNKNADDFTDIQKAEIRAIHRKVSTLKG